MKLFHYKAALLLALFLTTNVVAEEPKSVECHFDENNITNFPTHLTELQNLAIKLSPTLCKHSLLVIDEDVDKFNQQLFRFTSLAKDELVEMFPENSFSGMSAVAISWESQVNQYAKRDDYLNTIDFIVEKSVPGTPSYFKVRLPPHHQVDKKFLLNTDLKNKCSNISGVSDCKEAAESFNNAIKPIFQPLRLAYLEQQGIELRGLQTQWNDFIEHSRYQTELDVWITTVAHRDKFNGIDLVGPPSYQLFLFHPMLVYEHIDSADKGNRDDISVALEWAGINWWELGLGISVTSVYKDESDIKSIGTGLTLHIKNKYSIGIIHRSDGNNGIFINLDLMDWFGDNKEKYKKYRDYF